MDQTTLSYLAWFVALFAIVYFLMIRPNSKQQKKRNEILNSLKIKDEIVTVAGIYGTVTKLKEDTMTVKVAPNVEIEMTRSALQTIIEKEDPEEDHIGKKGRKVRYKKNGRQKKENN